MIGELHRSGVGEPICVDRVKSVEALRAGCKYSNEALLRDLREDRNAEALLKSTREDAAMGRMSNPVPIQKCDTSQILLNPRFGVEQEKDDGRMKIRAIDHLSWSPSTQRRDGMEPRPSKKARKEDSVNGYTAPAEKMSHDTLDVLAPAMCQFVDKVGCVPGLIKVCALHRMAAERSMMAYCVQADVDAAFRRIPVAPEHRWACGVAFKASDQVTVLRQRRAPVHCVAHGGRCTCHNMPRVHSTLWRRCTHGSE